MTQQNTQQVTPERIMQFAWGYAVPLMIESAIQNRIFDTLDKGAKTAEEVAKQPMFKEMPEFIRRYYESDRPIELRPVELGRYFGQKIDDGRIHVWIKTAATLPDDPALHMCALAYASDFSLLDAISAAVR